MANEGPFKDSWLGKISDWATTQTLWTIEQAGDWVSGFGDALLSFFRIKIRDEWNEDLREDARTAAEAMDLPQEAREELFQVGNLPFPLGFFALWAAIFFMGFNRFKVWMQGLAALSARNVSADLKPSLIGAGEMLRYKLLNPSGDVDAFQYLGELGLDGDQLEMAASSLRRLPEVGQLFEMRNREVIDQTTFTEILEQHGFIGADIQLLDQIRSVWPSPSDIASLAGREAFETESIERFNLGADFEKIPKEVYQKAGLSEEVMRWYWIAHWQNPGIQQVFRMLHRLRDPASPDHFGEADMDVFFNLADITPYFRERLKAISYLPLTRVDTRRMYEVGVLDYDGVLSSYRDQGYDAVNAERLADFTVRLQEYTERDLTRGQVEKLYEIGEIDYEGFLDALEAVGYDRTEAEYLAALKIAKIEEDRLDSFVDRAEQEYKRGEKNAAEIHSDLAKEGIRAGRIEAYLTQWRNEIAVDRPIPSVTQIRDMLRANVIEENQAREYLRARLYSTQTINHYLQLWG
jgi:hypothetical protein